MNIINKTRKGFTLIEVCVVFTILVIIIGITYPFFISNTKTLSETETRSDLQREGQYAIKYFTDKAMEAQKIVLLKDTSNRVVLSENDKIELDNISALIKEIEFSAPDAEGTIDSVISYYFTLKDSSLCYQQKSPDAAVDHSKDKIIAGNIQEIEVKTIDGKKFSECKGLNIKITLSKKEITGYVVESQTYFRNGNKDD